MATDVFNADAFNENMKRATNDSVSLKRADLCLHTELADIVNKSAFRKYLAAKKSSSAEQKDDKTPKKVAKYVASIGDDESDEEAEAAEKETLDHQRVKKCEEPAGSDLTPSQRVSHFLK